MNGNRLFTEELSRVYPAVPGNRPVTGMPDRLLPFVPTIRSTRTSQGRDLLTKPGRSDPTL
ncbi:MAG: hypothetical protein WC379_09175 [Methanoregula sp.]